jgi:protocatechuate 3,4-dioxygenase alpha subunit
MSTVGPFFKLLVRDRPEGSDTLVTDRTQGRRIAIEGTLFDGAGAPVLDGLVEIWQADANGRYRHPADPRGDAADPEFPGHGRVSTGDGGRFVFHTVLPGRVPVPGDSAGPTGALQAPHLLVSVMARGIMTRCWTRIYFADREDENAADPVLRLVPEARRGTLLAQPLGDGRYRIDICLQGDEETVFFNA